MQIDEPEQLTVSVETSSNSEGSKFSQSASLSIDLEMKTEPVESHSSTTNDHLSQSSEPPEIIAPPPKYWKIVHPYEMQVIENSKTLELLKKASFFVRQRCCMEHGSNTKDYLKLISV